MGAMRRLSPSAETAGKEKQVFLFESTVTH
jgi:hypothetical protein